VNADVYPRDPPCPLLLLKADDAAKGEMERRGGVRFLPPMAPMGLLRAVMFGEDDLLRINLDKDDMMIIIHNFLSAILVVSISIVRLLPNYCCNNA
jgi:hypothetical protein